MRTVLVTGNGGAGRTTVAAATALAAAHGDRSVLLLSTDRSGTAEAVWGTPAPRPTTQRHPGEVPWADPAEAAPGVWAARVTTADWFRGELAGLQDRGRGLLDMLGSDPLDGEETAEIPGVEALALLRALCAAATAGWDVLVVDLPPAPDAIGILALPAQLRRWLRRLLPPERQAARALRPVLAQLAGVPMPTRKLYESAGRWDVELAAVQDVIDSEATTVTLVVEPGPLAVRALRTARAGLALHGCRIEAVVANRLLPTGSADPWLAAASGRQQAALKELQAEWGPGDAPLRELPHLGREPLPLAGDLGAPGDGSGVEGLGALAAAVGEPGGRADRPAADPWSVEDRLAAEGVLEWRLPLPGADRDGLGLVRRGDELIVTVGPFHRVLPLSSALRRCTVAGAGLRDGVLRVRFEPDPALWPKGL